MDGFRPIQEADIGRAFKTLHPMMDTFTLTDYFLWGTDENSLTLVKEMTRDDGTIDIAAVAYLTFHSGYVKVEMLGRNKVSPEFEAYKGAGFDLLLFVEIRVAKANGFNEVRLDAIEGMVEQYRKKGYSEMVDAAYRLPDWGLLTPMRKFL
jgi:hypothetical protein